jgi:hypothetical protein
LKTRQNLSSKATVFPAAGREILLLAGGFNILFYFPLDWRFLRSFLP